MGESYAVAGRGECRDKAFCQVEHRRASSTSYTARTIPVMAHPTAGIITHGPGDRPHLVRVPVRLIVR